jgi:hypothetical protein
MVPDSAILIFLEVFPDEEPSFSMAATTLYPSTTSPVREVSDLKRDGDDKM